MSIYTMFGKTGSEGYEVHMRAHRSTWNATLCFHANANSFCTEQKHISICAHSCGKCAQHRYRAQDVKQWTDNKIQA